MQGGAADLRCVCMSSSVDEHLIAYEMDEFQIFEI